MCRPTSLRLEERLPSSARTANPCLLANGCRARTLQAVPDSSRRETPPETGDGAGTVEETREDRPACPKCGAPSEPVLTLPERPGENPEDVLGPIRKLVRQRGPPRSGGAT